MKVRIGIDVGGTFTDAALIDNDTYKLIDTAKVPTTHASESGVAAGIIQVLSIIMERNAVKPEDVIFIAHGTTQATNALLEGDVVKVGIVTIGSGLEGAKAKSDTKMGDILLTSAKKLNSANAYVDSTDPDFISKIAKAIQQLADEECKSIVTAEAFSVDNTTNEDLAVEECRRQGIPGTPTNLISKLYGLKVRTRTAVVNASIMPKMMEAANMTEDSIQKAGIKTPLMVMRCDGGVMTVDEVRKRPIMTILSGPAAGVAGALMYERLTDGIFLEVGGTSTDISCVKNGKVQVKYAVVGGHKTYLTSLDVRTVGIGGGSMVQVKNGKPVETGPRSAHIAGMEYEVYSDPKDIVNPVLRLVRPLEDDPEYACIECSNGKKYALTLSGAANIAGYVSEKGYAKGNAEAARKAWAPLAEMAGMSVEDTAKLVLNLSADKNSAVVRELMDDYNMEARTTVLVGGGGGSECVVPHLAEVMGFTHKIAQNAAVISTIGVALAMVRDMVERTIPNPTEADIIAVRREAENKAVASGANPESVEVFVEIDASSNLVRATAIGTTELRTKDLATRKLDIENIRKIVAENIGVECADIELVGDTAGMYAMQCISETKKFFGLIKKVNRITRIVDDEGIIRLQKKDGHVAACTGADWQKLLPLMVERFTDYSDGGKTLPNIYVIRGSKIIDLSGLENISSVMSVAGVEMAELDDREKVIILCSARGD